MVENKITSMQKKINEHAIHRRIDQMLEDGVTRAVWTGHLEIIISKDPIQDIPEGFKVVVPEGEYGDVYYIVGSDYNV